MAPMARTSRKDPSLNALDDLNLDDMFEGGQDGLFDELGMDLGELGDITDNGTGPAVPPVPKALDDMQFDLLGDIGVDDGATDAPEQQPVKKSRRKTKRKIKGSPPYDDESQDEEEPTRKKRRYTKKTKATTKKTKAAEAEAAAVTPPKKSKTKVSTAAPAALERNSSSSMVAAAGQFGGRHKRGNYPPLARGTSKSKVKATTATPKESSTAPAAVPVPKASSKATAEAVPPPPTTKRSRAVTEVVKPLETLFCGLQPSNTLFYPFLPSLPPEVSMKKCNKYYPILDKINTALNSTTPGPPEMDDPLLKLLMFHDPVPTKEKKMLMASSVISSRKAVQTMDKQALVADLTAVVTLVKRQHDFLAQSLDNMERWCKTSFTGDDYRAVYGGEKPKPLVAQLTSPIVRVKIRCNGWKEPKLSAPLIANVPMPGSSKSSSSSQSATTSKRKRAETSASIPDKPTINQPVLHYVDMTPNARRQRLIELVAKHGQVLEAKHVETDESRRKAIEKQRQAQQKVVDEDDLLQVNTMTLWKWIDKAGYFGDFNEQDLNGLLVYQPEVNEEHTLWEDTATKKKSPPVQDSLYDRLQSLLVEVSDDENDDKDDDDENDEESKDNENGAWDTSNGAGNSSHLVNLSQLTMEERAYVHLRAAGLVDESRPPPEEPVADTKDKVDEGSGEFEELLRRMKTDLVRIDRLNNSRTAFLDASARAHLLLTKYAKRQDERQTQMVTKVNQILKKQKENKRSARQKVHKKDEDWVPW